MELRRIQRRSASPAPAEHGEEPSAANAVRALLRLQRGAGNAAVTQLVGERTLSRGQGSSTSGGPRRYWLMIGDLQIPMTLTRGYFRFEAAPRSYIYSNSELKIDEATSQITVNNPDYAEQIARFSNGKLQLWRGITRQHPLFYEVDQVHIVLPLGTGELPDFDTNKTSFIPFGHSEGSAKGIAIGKRGDGPRRRAPDDRQLPGAAGAGHRRPSAA